MSEYQYYEFLALDRALTSKQREELRELSTRAEITATRFTNEYHWGSFRGDPQEMMASYFDAFLYLANWGTRHLMFRVPSGALDTGHAGQYCYTDAASLIKTGDHLIISLYADREPDDYWDETAGELGSMVAARSELLAGDHRLLYLGWLMGIQWDHVDDEDTEPPVPAGLRELSGALVAIAGFLDIDQDLIAVAAEASPVLTDEPAAGLADWVAALPAAEKDKFLTMVADGEGAQVQAHRSLLSGRLAWAGCLTGRLGWAQVPDCGRCESGASKPTSLCLAAASAIPMIPYSAAELSNGSPLSATGPLATSTAPRRRAGIAWPY